MLSKVQYLLNHLVCWQERALEIQSDSERNVLKLGSFSWGHFHHKCHTNIIMIYRYFGRTYCLHPQILLPSR